ncbi:MAG: CVNH domain-containing protein, partial [Nostoc sp.]|uniref:mannose-binding lectin n=1 Tax=Nostoc sp. TaxID=1180 RepID=UPI002FF78D30
QKSCSNIKVENGDLLSATCIKIDGSYNNTSIHIPGIENINGVLTFNNSYSSSSYQKSCSNIKVENGDLLSATCIKIDGSYNNTSIRIPGIENINGVLTFNNSYSSSSYQKSCSNIKVENGDLLSATCIKIDGSYNNTSIRIPGIENINGVLTFNNSYNCSSWISKLRSRSPDEATKLCVK